MKTANKQERKQKKEEKRSAFWSFMGGDFLLHKKVMQFYPYFFMLFALAAIIIANDAWIGKKEKKLQKIENEYKTTVSKIKKQNEFLPYDTATKLMELLQEEGFKKDQKQLYKIPVKSNE